MKRLAIGLITAALSTCVLIPSSQAQSWEDMQSDRNAIQEGHEKIHHDKRELRDDLRRGDFGAAAHEQAEMERRRERLQEQKEDLSNDVDRDLARHHHHDDDDD
jgi:Spy/CpxP family protein refolding chaperone